LPPARLPWLNASSASPPRRRVLVSIFNDVLGPVMRGASSSHCAAALRIGRLARDLMAAGFDEVVVAFDRHGSLPTTHESQGSDMGLCGGLLGWEADDARLPDSAQALAALGLRLRFDIAELRDPHPNTYRLSLRNTREEHSLIAVSTGGGMIEVIDIDGFGVSLFGDYHETLLWLNGDGTEAVSRLQQWAELDTVLLHQSAGRQLVEVKAPRFLTDAEIADLGQAFAIQAVRRLNPVLPVLSHHGMRVPFDTCDAMLRYDASRNTPLWRLAAEYEMARGQLTEAEVMARMLSLVRLWRRSIHQGIAGTRFEDRLLGHQSGRFQQQMAAGALLDAGMLNRAILYVSALMEVKSAMGVIVAAPTAGACAALPGAVIAAAEERCLGEDDMARALLASGLIGVFIATHWTFAAEVGGCQAEGGSAACMAAAALAVLANGSLHQTVAAASLALQGMLGLICDPVAGRVEVPCLTKNVLAASHALASANMALADFDPVIPLDEVIESARRVGEQMPRELRCTALGGLAITPTSLALEKQLAAKKATACAGSCDCASQRGATKS
jgi:L-serine dehydratase